MQAHFPWLLWQWFAVGEFKWVRDKVLNSYQGTLVRTNWVLYRIECSGKSQEQEDQKVNLLLGIIIRWCTRSQWPVNQNPDHSFKIEKSTFSGVFVQILLEGVQMEMLSWSLTRAVSYNHHHFRPPLWAIYWCPHHKLPATKQKIYKFSEGVRLQNLEMT